MKVQVSNKALDEMWCLIYSYGTKIALKCKKILQFKYIKKKSEKKYQQGAIWCTLGTIYGLIR
jgi:hypothetical protein